jgi:hypothetical protein
MRVSHKILQRIANNLPLNIIDHPTGAPDAKPYLRRYYVGTMFGIRCYLHHFVDNDPDGLHNHPARLSMSIVLSGIYQEERRWCPIPRQRTVRWFNVLSSDSLHRVLLFRDGAGNPLTVWSLFFHTRKVMPWATIKDKGLYKQYYEHYPSTGLVDGHSQWFRKAKKGKELLAEKEFQS